MGQTTLILMILTVISKIFGFVRESVMAAYIGAGELKSIYTTATSFPTLLVNVVISGIASSYIPIYNKAFNEKGKAKAEEFTSNLLNIMMVYAAIILVIILIFAKPISKMLSPNLEGEWLNLAAIFTRIQMFAIFAFLYASVISGYLNIKGNFYDPVITGIILNLVVIISTILTGKYNKPYILIFGTLLANIIQYIKFPKSSKELGFKHHKKLDFSDKYIKSLMIMIVPIMLSSAADQLSILIDNSMASAYFGISSVSKIYYAKTMLNFIMGVVTMSVATVTFPDIAKLGQSGNIAGMKEKINISIVFSMLLVIPATLGMMALSNPIIKFAFERNAFTSNDTEIVASLLVSYAPYIIFASLLKVMSNGFYSVGDSKTPVVVILIQQALNVILNIILVKFLGIDGLAYATSISTAIGSLILVIAFSNKFGRLENKKDIISLFKILLSSIIMIIIARIIFKVLNLSLTVSLLISVLIAGIIYLLLIKLMKIEEVEVMFKNVRDKFSKK